MKQIPTFVIPSASGPEIEICISFEALAGLGTREKTRESKTTFNKIRNFCSLPEYIDLRVQETTHRVQAVTTEQDLINYCFPAALKSFLSSGGIAKSRCSSIAVTVSTSL